MPTEAPTSVQPRAEGDTNLLTVAAIFLRHWKVVAACIAGGLLLGLIFVIIKPDVYTARVVMVPSQDQSPSSLFASQLPTGLAGLAGVSSPNREKQITAILRSRTIADSVAARVLPSGTNAEQREAWVYQLRKRTKVDVTAQGEFVVAVRDRDPEQAAWIANEYGSLANSLSADIGRQALSVKGAFLERQLGEARERLVASEEALLRFQQQSDAPDIQEQARQTVEAAADIQRMIFQKELELVHLRRVATPDNPELRAATAELNTLRQQLKRLTSGAAGRSDVFVPLGESPQLRVGSVRLLREFTKDEQVYLSLTAALAETQLDVQNNLPVVALLDPATVPREPSGIPRWIVFGLIVWLGLIGGLVLAAIMEYFARMARDPVSTPFFSAWDSFLTSGPRLLRK